MWRDLHRGRALANLLFVIAVFAVAGFAIRQVAWRQWRVQKTFQVNADFAAIGGVDIGQRVRLQGIDAGVVESVVAPTVPGAQVRLVFRIDERLRPLIRTDAVAKIVSEGVVGPKVVEIVPGRADAPLLSGSSPTIASEHPFEMGDLMKRAVVSLDRLDAVTIAAEKGLGEINLLASTVRKGEGSLGKLVKEDEAYRRLVSLTERGEKTLGELQENLGALKQTWPISRYFNNRAFLDKDRVLFHPGSARDSRILREEELFEPGRSTLTALGRKKLDEVGSWFNKAKRPTSEVVIAGFSDDSRDPDLVQALTQEQVEAVRKYLVEKFALDSTGWFSSRKVAAVGFGLERPRTLDGTTQDLPPRRVEIFLFTPQA